MIPEISKSLEEIVIYTVGAILTFILIRLYVRGGICRGNRNMQGKVVVITGGNAGIGRETVEVLSGKDCTVVFGARDKVKSEKVVSEIKTKLPNCKLIYLPLDLANKSSI